MRGRGREPVVVDERESCWVVGFTNNDVRCWCSGKCYLWKDSICKPREEKRLLRFMLRGIAIPTLLGNG